MTYDEWKSTEPSDPWLDEQEIAERELEDDMAKNPERYEDVPTRGDGTTSLSLGFEQSLLDAEKERAEPQGEPGWMPLKLRTDL